MWISLRKEGKSKLAALAVPLINRIPGEMLRVYLRNILGQKLGILDPTQIEALLPTKKSGRKSLYIKRSKMKRTHLMRLLIALLIQNPYL